MQLNSSVTKHIFFPNHLQLKNHGAAPEVKAQRAQKAPFPPGDLEEAGESADLTHHPNAPRMAKLLKKKSRTAEKQPDCMSCCCQWLSALGERGSPRATCIPIQMGEVVGAVGAVGAAGAAVLGVSPVQDGGSQSGVNLFPCRLY